MGIQPLFYPSRLVKRFTLLNQAVVQIGLGGTERLFPFMGTMNWGELQDYYAILQLQCKNSNWKTTGMVDCAVIEADLRKHLVLN